MESMSPALAGRFLTTGPSEKSSLHLKKEKLKTPCEHEGREQGGEFTFQGSQTHQPTTRSYERGIKVFSHSMEGRNLLILGSQTSSL